MIWTFTWYVMKAPGLLYLLEHGADVAEAVIISDVIYQQVGRGVTQAETSIIRPLLE